MEKVLNMETEVSLTTVLDIMPKRMEWTALYLRIHGELGGGFSSCISET
jgi:hypothetical protein